ncbi:hypothetical protein O3P69_015549 [Scylla paramamosain]|uniref:Uncharacterized protein n=1 Tax=Scylla paramamosain TaxID=85552 RepID=A0AAW0SEM0_SCYPA
MQDYQLYHHLSGLEDKGPPHGAILEARLEKRDSGLPPHTATGAVTAYPSPPYPPPIPATVSTWTAISFTNDAGIKISLPDSACSVHLPGRNPDCCTRTLNRLLRYQDWHRLPGYLWHALIQLMCEHHCRELCRGRWSLESNRSHIKHISKAVAFM